MRFTGLGLLRIVDPVHLASTGFGVALDLEKKGFDVRLDEYHEVAVRPHRIGTPDDADAVLRFVVGGDLIAEQQRHDGAELLAEVDPPGQEPPLAMFLEPVPSARSGVSSRRSYRGFAGPGCRSLLAETAGALSRLGTPGDGDKRTTGAPLIPD